MLCCRIYGGGELHLQKGHPPSPSQGDLEVLKAKITVLSRDPWPDSAPRRALQSSSFTLMSLVSARRGGLCHLGVHWLILHLEALAVSSHQRGCCGATGACEVLGPSIFSPGILAQGGGLGTCRVGQFVLSPVWRMPQIPVESGGAEGTYCSCLKRSTILGSRYRHVVSLGTGLPRKMDVTVVLMDTALLPG